MISKDDVEEALRQGGLPEHVQKVHDDISGSLKSLLGMSRRSAVSLLLTAFAMELFRRANISGITFAGIEIRDLTVIQEVTPLLGAYLFFDLWLNAVRYLRDRRIILYINEIYRPEFVTKRLLAATLPPAASFFGPPVHLVAAPGRLRTTLGVAGALLRVSAALAPLGLILWWYVDLFRRLGPDPLLLISSAAATAFVSYAGLLAAMALRNDIVLLQLDGP